MKFKLVAAVLVAGALVCGPVRAQDADAIIHSDLVEVLAATNAALDAQSAFWSKLLRQEVAARSTNPEMATIAAELNEFAARAVTRIASVVLEGDMAGLERVLDESADTLTGLANAIRRLILSMNAG